MNPAPPPPAAPAEPHSFAALVAARRAWIDETLRPWCRSATLRDLRMAEAAWADLAGDVGARETLWAWAWERFPALCEPGLVPPAESRAVRVTLIDGRVLVGAPDGRRSLRGVLWLVSDGDAGWEDHGPFPLDELLSVERDGDATASGKNPPPRPITMPH